MKKTWSGPECETLGVQRASGQGCCLVVPLQVGRTCLESPKILAYIVHLEKRKGEEKGDGTDDQCQGNTQERKGEGGLGIGQGWGQKLRTSMRHRWGPLAL